MKRIKILTMAGISLLCNYKGILKSKEVVFGGEWKEKILEWMINETTPQVASAELNSLEALLNEDTETGYEVDFICSDNDNCVFAAECVAEYLRRQRSERIIVGKINRIAGLQVEDFSRFEREGREELVSVLNELTECYKPDEVLVNITGGYKAFIPYMTIIAQMKGYELIYIYERTDKLVHIPCVMSIDMDRFQNMLRELKDSGLR